MQWDADGSFTDAPQPWLPFAPDHARVNVAAQREDPDSLLPSTAALLGRAARAGPPTRAYRTLSAAGHVLRFARGDSIEVRIDFAAGDGGSSKAA